MSYEFGEKKTEYSQRQGKDIPVWQTSKYKESKAKAIEVIESEKFGVLESDFWILMNESKNGKMSYSGLIISHNGCLKINDALENKFHPESVFVDKEGWGGSLVVGYCDEEQGIYEFGEVSPKNCKNDYPYAMALKRLFDRVVLKLSKIAYAGIYSEAESDEFRQPEPTPKPKTAPEKQPEVPAAPEKRPARKAAVKDAKPSKPVKNAPAEPEKSETVKKAEEDLQNAKVSATNVTALFKRCEEKNFPMQKILDAYKVNNPGELTIGQWMAIMKRLESK